MKTVLCYGAGTNSVAMLAGIALRSEAPPDLILFADTGGEKPHTYAHIEEVQKWLRIRNWPQITIVYLEKRIGWESLEDECLRLGTLPPIAYGFKTCSQKYKIRPQEKFLKTWYPEEPITKLIGYDFDETRRWRNRPTQDGRYTLRFPLVEWGWGRDDCIEAIPQVGLSLPGKSACFFCPSSKKAEVRELQSRYPDLYERAVAIERTARERTGFRTVKGLGRNFSWEKLEDGLDTPPSLDCGCYDGEYD